MQSFKKLNLNYFLFLIVLSMLLGVTTLSAQTRSNASTSATKLPFDPKHAKLSLLLIYNPIYDFGYGLEFSVSMNNVLRSSSNQMYGGTQQFSSKSPLKSMYYVGNRSTRHLSKDSSLKLFNNTVYRFLLANESDASIHQLSNFSEIQKTIGKMTLFGGLNLPLVTKASDPTLFSLRQEVKDPFTVAGAYYTFGNQVSLGLAQYRQHTFATIQLKWVMLSFNLNSNSEDDNTLWIGTPWITF